MAAFTVYSTPGSPYGRSVLATLEEKRVPYRLVAVGPGETKSPAHLARNAFGKVPVLDHAGFVLYESQAILRYLDRVLPEPALTPANAQMAARMDQALNINDWYVFQGVANVIVYHRVIAPRLFGLAPDEAAIAAAMPRARLVIGELARLLGTQPYFAGASVSLADLALAPQLDFLAVTPEWAELAAPHASLVAWLARMTDRPSLRATTWECVTDMALAA